MESRRFAHEELLAVTEKLRYMVVAIDSEEWQPRGRRS